QEDRARAAVAHLGFDVLIAPDDDGFVRRSPWLRELLAQVGADLYYTSHYTVDRECRVPFVFTIHDLTRLRFPELSYTDTSFVARFGQDEHDVLRAELAALSHLDVSVDTQDMFTRYFWAINRDLVRRAERLITVSDATAHDICTLLQAPPQHVALV